jgi:hypothetical protein
MSASGHQFSPARDASTKGRNVKKQIRLFIAGRPHVAWLFRLLLLLLLACHCSAAELRDLKVFYVGNTRSARAAEFKTFLRANFAQAAVAERTAFDPAQANGFDVVLLDWPQSEERGKMPTKSPLGERSAWNKPTVLLGSAGLHSAMVWDVKGGFG